MVLVDGAFRRQIQADLEADLTFARRVAVGAWNAELGDQVETSAVSALDPRLRAAVSTEDPATIRQTLEEVFQETSRTWAAVLTPDGRLLASTPDAPAVPLAVDDPLLSEARYFDTGDLRSRDGCLELVAVSAVLFGAEHSAVLVTGHRIDEVDAASLEAAVGRPVVLVGPGTVAAGTEAAEALPSGLPPGAFESVSGVDPAVRPFRADGERFLAAPTVLESPTAGPLGTLVLFESLDAGLAPVDALRSRLLVILALGLLLTLAVGAVFFRSVTVPVDRLLADTERLGSGDLDEPIVPLRDDEIGRLAASFEDMRTSLKGARTELLRAERLGAIGQAASAVAHDFTQPLSTISGAVGLLRMGVEDDDAREQCFEAIEGQIDRLGRMKEEIVDFARGRRDFEGASIRYDSFLENTVSGLKADLAARGVELRVVHGFDGEWLIDSYRLGRVVENLVRNAGAAGAERIVVETSLDGGVLVMTVADDGSGIPDDLIDDIFEPFVTRGKKEGTGLGLAIAHNVVVEHGGTIDVESSAAGTRFTIRLPRDGARMQAGDEA